MACNNKKGKILVPGILLILSGIRKANDNYHNHVYCLFIH